MVLLHQVSFPRPIPNLLPSFPLFKPVHSAHQIKSFSFCFTAQSNPPIPKSKTFNVFLLEIRHWRKEMAARTVAKDIITLRGSAAIVSEFFGIPFSLFFFFFFFFSVLHILCILQSMNSFEFFVGYFSNQDMLPTGLIVVSCNVF